MEQQIRFCTTADGVRIAYAVVGVGPPLIWIPGWVSHLEFMWEDPWIRAWFQPLADHFTLVRYDKRGAGLSDRNVGDYSVEARLKDLEAVVHHLKLRQFFLWGFSEGGPVAIAYAARNPRRVSRLVLYGTFARGWRSEVLEALLGLVRAEWGLGSTTLTNVFMPGATPDQARAFTRLQRMGATPEDAAAMLAQNMETNVTDLLSRVNCPTLVAHARGDRAVSFERGREIVGAIADARLLPIESERHVLEDERRDELARSVIDFLLEDAPGPPAERTKGPARSALTTVLFTDLVGHTEMMQRLGDAKGRDVLREHERIAREALKAHGGAEVKTMGDGFMASFASVTKAIECAVAMQRAFAERNGAAAEPLHVRVGLNVGEPIAEDGDLFGATVILAARIAANAQGGEILCSNVVRELAAGKGFLFADRGDAVLRGFEDPVRLFEVRWQAEGSP